MAPFTMRLLVEYTTFLAATSSTLCTSTSICKPISSDAPDAEHLPTTSTVVSSTSTSRMPHYTQDRCSTTKITFWLLPISDYKPPVRRGYTICPCEVPPVDTWQPDVKFHDAGKVNGLDFPMTIRSSNFTQYQDIEGMDPSQVPLWKFLCQGLCNNWLR